MHVALVNSKRERTMITLYRENGVWMSDNSKANDAAEILRLFGTYHLATPYDASVPGAQVRAELAVLNDKDAVVLRD
jgi:hypothetical protein